MQIPDTNFAIPDGALFVAPDGDDGNAGTIDAPFATVAHAVSVAASGAADGEAGRCRVKIAPPSGALAALTDPPCCSATCRTIARPSPEPGRPRAEAPR